MPDETTPQLSKSEYETEVETLAERMLRQFADDETGELAYEESEIRPLLGETETFHEEYPLSALKHSQHDPNPGAWSWINDTAPRKGLCRQALDVIAQDVAKLVELYAGTEAYTYWQDESIYVRKSFDSGARTSFEEGSDNPTDENDRTRLTVTTNASDVPATETDEYEQMMRTVKDAVDGALYENGCIGHDTTVSIEESR